MTQIFDENGVVVPVTVIEAGPLKVIQIKLQKMMGIMQFKQDLKTKKENRVNMPMKGHFDKVGVEYKKNSLENFQQIMQRILKLVKK